MKTQEVEKHPAHFLTVRWFLIIVGISLSYAILRYNVFAGVTWSHLPLFINNKAISLAAVIFIGASYLIGKFGTCLPFHPGNLKILIEFSGLAGFSLAALHSLISLLLFTPAYYPKFFFEDESMNLTGELSMLFGVLSLWCLTVTAIHSMPYMSKALGAKRWKQGQQMGYACLALAGGHVLVMGLAGWLKPGEWHGFLPPISLLAFIAAVIPLLVKIIGPAPTMNKRSPHSGSSHAKHN